MQYTLGKRSCRYGVVIGDYISCRGKWRKAELSVSLTDVSEK